MRIGIVTAVYKPVINGVTRMVLLYKQHLEAAGHDVTIFTIGDPDPDDEPNVVRSPGFMVSDRGYYLTVGYSREAQKLLRQMDILHCHHLFMSVELAHRYGRCPIIYTNHTRYDLYGNTVFNLPQPAADAILRQVWPEFCDYADLVITPSESVRQVMLEFGVHTPIVTIENGVDLEPFYNLSQPRCKRDFGLPETAVLLMYVGRLASEKNVELLLDQFAIAADLAPDLHLMLVGDGLSRPELERQADAVGIADQVHFAGAVAYEDVPNYMAAADMFVTASITEVHPLTVIEAMATGLPVVAVSSPGIVDSVESGVSGLLTTRPDGGLAAAMVALAFNPEQRQKMSAAALETSARFDIVQKVERTVAFYEQLHTERPDLGRKKQHGRRFLYKERFQQSLERFLGPTDKIKLKANWFDSDSWSKGQNNRHDNWQ
ncbi:MAG: glycosyltransferase family 4 protein [Chloroflexi bacterium]|nr:glycosyltransferase family 4 protein [Chloroflexota bacterium]